MKKHIVAVLFMIVYFANADNKGISADSSLNMDAVYKRPYITEDEAKVSIGGYVSVNYFRDVEDGISEGHSFGMPRLTMFLNSNISSNIRFLTELEFEAGGDELAIEFAALDFVFDPLLTLRGGIIMNPIGSFNQNHDDPKWEFNRRPVYATQLLPATLSSVGFGVYGKTYWADWTLGYEAYLTNGFDGSIIDNPNSKTFLPAIKSGFERFEESSNGKPMFTGKIAVQNLAIGEFGFSAMFGDYNLSVEDGVEVATPRGLSVVSFDYNHTLPFIETKVAAEVSLINVDIPEDYFAQYGRKQFGGFMDIVQPVGKFDFMNFKDIESNLALRFDYADWNVGKFTSSQQSMSDEYFAITPALSLRPDPNTVVRLNYGYAWVYDFLGNKPTQISTVSVGLSSYF